MKKHLFSFKYIPENFDGILVGPSLSDIMMDTKRIKSHKIYNLSMNAANISELKIVIDNVLDFGDIKTMIICIDPYITKNSGMKSSQINSKEYIGSLGSIFSIKHFYTKYIYNKKENDEFFDSYWGYINNKHNTKDLNSTEEINKVVESLDSKKYDLSSLAIDERAYNELDKVLKKVRDKNINLIVYHYPTPYRILNHPLYAKYYKEYRKNIDKLTNSIEVIDMTSMDYRYISDNDDSYSDRGHLSEKGAYKVLEKKLNEDKKYAK